MNRFQNPRYTMVEGYRACTAPCCKTTGGTIVTVRDSDGHLIERVPTSALQIVAGPPNLSRLEQWEADGRPDLRVPSILDAA